MGYDKMVLTICKCGTGMVRGVCQKCHHAGLKPITAPEPAGAVPGQPRRPIAAIEADIAREEEIFKQLDEDSMWVPEGEARAAFYEPLVACRKRIKALLDELTPDTCSTTDPNT